VFSIEFSSLTQKHSDIHIPIFLTKIKRFVIHSIAIL